MAEQQEPPDDRADEAARAQPGDIFYAGGKVYRKLPGGTAEWLGYQFVGAEPEHEPS